MSKIYESILDTVGNTPIVRINKLNKGKANVFAKVEYFNPAGSVKDRVAARAAELRTPGWRSVLVSGTASILPGSHDVAHVGDIDAQVDCTMRAVEAIYESRGMSWGDVSGALVYLKRESYRGAWSRWLEEHPEFPREHSRAIVADVCRPEWLFEIESDATKCK